MELLCVCCMFDIFSTTCYLSVFVALMCPPLDAPGNGTVVWTGLTPGSIATYSCNDGYALIGVKTRECQSDESWSDVPPTCECTQNLQQKLV